MTRIVDADSQKLAGWLRASGRCFTALGMRNALVSLPGGLGDGA
ncbi:hypothetical protein EV128_12795 [Rhizobium azibense]|nr:hypothetical protein EV128_12795 [Rhizobium azibense]